MIKGKGKLKGKSNGERKGNGKGFGKKGKSMNSVGKKKPKGPVNGTMTMVRGDGSVMAASVTCRMKSVVTGMRDGLQTGRTSKDNGIRNGLE